jgi:hypothetical protein
MIRMMRNPEYFKQFVETLTSDEQILPFLEEAVVAQGWVFRVTTEAYDSDWKLFMLPYEMFQNIDTSLIGRLYEMSYRQNILIHTNFDRLMVQLLTPGDYRAAEKVTTTLWIYEDELNFNTEMAESEGIGEVETKLLNLCPIGPALIDRVMDHVYRHFKDKDPGPTEFASRYFR